MKALIFVFLILGSAEQALAGGVFRQAAMYMWNKEEQTTTTEQSRLLLDFSLAYMSEGSGVYFGFMYAIENGALKSGNSDIKTNRTSNGPSIGLVGQNLGAILTYFLSTEYAVGGNTFAGGSGYQLDLLYRVSVGGWFLGPQLSYKQFTYTKSSTGATLTPSYMQGYLDPYIFIWIPF